MRNMSYLKKEVYFILNILREKMFINQLKKFINYGKIKKEKYCKKNLKRFQKNTILNLNIDREDNMKYVVW